MEPAFHAGDLAVVRRAADYEVGDVVAYRSPQLDRVVLHRIVERDGTELVFQGDNNDFVDPEQLDADHVVGRLVVRVPHGGDVLSWLADPLHATAVAVALSSFPALVLARRRRRLGRRQRPASPARPAMKPATARRLRVGAAWTAVGGACLVAGGAVALARNEHRPVDHEIGFVQRGEFSYGTGAAGPLYPSGLTTGDPVFRRLADAVTVRFAYAVEQDTGVDVDLDGTVAVAAVLSGDGGWERTVPLLARRPLRAAVPTSVELDLDRLELLAAEAAAITGTAEAGVRVAVVPSVAVEGVVAGRPVDDRFAPSLAFTLDDVALRPTPSGEDAGFVETRPGSVTVPGVVAARLSLPLPGPDPTVGAARTVGLAGGAALLLVALGLLLAARPRGRGEAARIEARFGHLLLSVRAPEHGRDDAVDVTTFADLARVAEHHERLVLHHTTGDRHTYLVEVDTTTYRYTTASAVAAVADVADITTAPRAPRHARRTAAPARPATPAPARVRRAPQAPAPLLAAVGSPIYMR
jgi:hypothetical protein